MELVVLRGVLKSWEVEAIMTSEILPIDLAYSKLTISVISLSTISLDC